MVKTYWKRKIEPIVQDVYGRSSTARITGNKRRVMRLIRARLINLPWWCGYHFFPPWSSNIGVECASGHAFIKVDGGSDIFDVGVLVAESKIDFSSAGSSELLLTSTVLFIGCRAVDKKNKIMLLGNILSLVSGEIRQI